MNEIFIQNRLIFFIFLTICAVQDIKKKSIEERIYIIFGIIGIISSVYMKRTVSEILTALIPGLILMLISKLSNEALGMGDALFYITAAFYIKLSEIITILLISFALCGFISLIIIVNCIIKNKNKRGITIPYLTIVFPIGIAVAAGGI